MRLEVQLAAPPIGYVRVQLRRGKVGMAEHLLDGAQVGSALEQVRGEGVAQKMRVDALGIQSCLARETAKHEEDPGAREGAAARVQEELRAMAGVEERPAAGEEIGRAHV